MVSEMILFLLIVLFNILSIWCCMLGYLDWQILLVFGAMDIITVLGIRDMIYHNRELLLMIASHRNYDPKQYLEIANDSKKTREMLKKILAGEEPSEEHANE